MPVAICNSYTVEWITDSHMVGHRMQKMPLACSLVMLQIFICSVPLDKRWQPRVVNMDVRTLNSGSGCRGWPAEMIQTQMKCRFSVDCKSRGKLRKKKLTYDTSRHRLFSFTGNSYQHLSPKYSWKYDTFLPISLVHPTSSWRTTFRNVHWKGKLTVHMFIWLIFHGWFLAPELTTASSKGKLT